MGLSNNEMIEKFNSNEKLIWYIINKYKFTTLKIEKEDLYSIGRVGLWKACKSYNNKGNFTNFAYTCIKNEILYAYRNLMIKQIPMIDLSIETDETSKLIFDDIISTNDNYNLSQNIFCKVFNDYAKNILTKKQYIIYSYMLQDYTYEEIGEKLNISRQAVGQAMQYIRKKLTPYKKYLVEN